VGDAIIAVHIVPTGIDNFAIIIDAGVPFVGFVITDGDDIGAIGVHRVQRESHQRAGGAAAQIAAAALGHKGDPSARQPAGVEVIEAAVHESGPAEVDRTVRQLG